MCVQRGRAIETFAADFAPMRFLLRVNDFVPAQGACLTKSFATNLALKWSGTGVHWHVARQIVMGTERFQADPALKWANGSIGCG